MTEHAPYSKFWVNVFYVPFAPYVLLQPLCSKPFDITLPLLLEWPLTLSLTLMSLLFNTIP